MQSWTTSSMVRMRRDRVAHTGGNRIKRRAVCQPAGHVAGAYSGGGGGDGEVLLNLGQVPRTP